MATTRARMIDDLADEMARHLGPISVEDRAFYDSISGKEVELVFTHGDAFEKNDNNYWLPNHTWTEID